MAAIGTEEWGNAGVVPSASGSNVFVTELRAGDLSIPVGTTVEIKGCQSKPELNGQRATIDSYDRPAKRYILRLGGDALIAMKPKNVSVVDALTFESLGYKHFNEAEDIPDGTLVFLRPGDLDVLIRDPENCRMCPQFRSIMDFSRHPDRGDGGPTLIRKPERADGGFERYKPRRMGRPHAISLQGGRITKMGSDKCPSLFYAPGEMEITCVTGAFPLKEPAPGELEHAEIRYAVRKRLKIHASPNSSRWPSNPAKRPPKLWVQIGKLDRDGVAFQVAFQQASKNEVQYMALQHRAAAEQRVSSRIERARITGEEYTPPESPLQEMESSLSNMWTVVDVAITSPISAPPFAMAKRQVTKE